LHEQASSSYAALAALVPTDGPTGADLPAGAAARPDAPPEAWAARLRPVPLVPVSQVLTERMAAQAESLRELIGAIRPQASAGAAGLAPILQAYVDSLEDGTAPPVTVVDVAEVLVLDWVTETVALR